MTVVPQGKITVKGQAAPVYYQIGLSKEMYSSDVKLGTGTVKRVYNKMKNNGVTYYDLGDSKYVKANSNVKYEAVPPSVRSCMQNAVSDYNVKVWVSEAKKLKTSLAQLMYLFQRLTEHVTYDYPLYEGTGGDPLGYTSKGALANGLAVCQGYAEAFQLLLTKIGIENKTISGYGTNGSRPEPHMWNLVKLGGLYYHVDTTWGDGYVGGQFHYFLLPDQDMKRDHQWSMKTYATSDKYAYYNRIGNAFYIDYKNETYDEVVGGTIMRYPIGNKSKAVRIAPKEDYVYRTPQVYNGKMYYLTIGGLKRMSLDGSNDQILSKTVSNNFIVFNDKVYYTQSIVSYDGPYALNVIQSNLDGSSPETVYTFTDRDRNFAGFYVAEDGAHSTLNVYTDDKKMIRLDSF
ncbi:transglutaminase domain-containing protein [Paenibacillus xylaniclasticus]|uniref:transglutaminase domain-containing protein n=1 Tax=Paenibacillus xylaniclasticus TaxID=588083 RepID=UPI000FD88D16|nr:MULTISPECIES: transglutaminase domain-containing protein [Paenibacillus]GFN33221.1 hypothetical protein PCURB6_34810 [Paenibacillus curdlanolyticus]